MTANLNTENSKSAEYTENPGKRFTVRASIELSHLSLCPSMNSVSKFMCKNGRRKTDATRYVSGCHASALATHFSSYEFRRGLAVAILE